MNKYMLIMTPYCYKDCQLALEKEVDCGEIERIYEQARRAQPIRRKLHQGKSGRELQTSAEELPQQIEHFARAPKCTTKVEY